MSRIEAIHQLLEIVDDESHMETFVLCLLALGVERGELERAADW
jgi:hypothetical protein